MGRSRKTVESTELGKVLKNYETENEGSMLYARIVALRKEKGFTYAKIASEVGVSKSTVCKYLKMWKTKIPVSEVKPSGRPKKVTERVKRQIRTIITNNPCISSKGIAKKLGKGDKGLNSTNVSARTVRRTLNGMSYANDIPRVVPMLTELQKSKRVDWCKNNKKKNWDKVIFSDETSIELDRCKIRRWHPDGKRPEVGKSKHSRKLMFWSVIGINCKAPLFVLKGTVNSEKYIELLEKHFLPWFREKCDDTYTFQQDNAPAHVSRKSTSFIQSQSLQILDWPANSPDINPIENIWSILKNEVEKRAPINLAELERIAKEEWTKIPQQKIRKTVKSMGRRIKQVLDRKGGKCDY